MENMYEQDLLTFKVERDFDDWIGLDDIPHISREDIWIFDLPISMQFGVFFEYFQSHNIILDIQPCSCHNPTIFNVNIIHPAKDFVEVSEKKDIREAWKIAINKASEILEKKL